MRISTPSSVHWPSPALAEPVPAQVRLLWALHNLTTTTARPAHRSCHRSSYGCCVRRYMHILRRRTTNHHAFVIGHHLLAVPPPTTAPVVTVKQLFLLLQPLLLALLTCPVFLLKPSGEEKGIKHTPSDAVRCCIKEMCLLFATAERCSDKRVLVGVAHIAQKIKWKS